MLSLKKSIITGGTFIQHNDNRTFYVQQAPKGAYDRLQDAVATAAFHNSGERFDPPKCHPNTRVAVIRRIMDWILRNDAETRDKLIMWLSGPAGAGKSAIAQSIAELCHAEKYLLASFFFGRSDATRNHGRSLMATIAYQVYSTLSAVQSRITTAIEEDPLIFSRSILAQFTSLIIEPLQDLFDSRYFDQPGTPRLILIDGLDECLDQNERQNIISTILQVSNLQIPFIFLVASRPEHDITTGFSSAEINTILTQLVLDDNYLPSKDIALFIRDELHKIKITHAFKRQIPATWPNDEVVEALVEKSSGQFIYAATVVKYVKSARHRPHQRVEIILKIRPSPSQDLPFAELDGLYTHILSTVDDIETVLQVFSFIMTNPSRLPTIDDIEDILEMERGDIEVAFYDLASLVRFEEKPFNLTNTRLVCRVWHASLEDFFLDPTRSKKFHINTEAKFMEHAGACFRFLSRPSYEIILENAIVTAFIFLDGLERRHAKFTPEIGRDIANMSIPRLYKAINETSVVNGKLEFLTSLTHIFTHTFFPALFKFLEKSDDAESKSLLTYHLRGFDEFMMIQMQTYELNIRVILQLSLVCLFGQHKFFPAAALHHDFWIFEDDFQVINNDRVGIDLCKVSPPHEVHTYYRRLMADFMMDPSRSGQYALGEGTHAKAALCCLKYLCNDPSSPRKLLRSRYTKRELKIRRNKPWKWIRKSGRRWVTGLYRTTARWILVRRLLKVGNTHHFILAERPTLLRTYRKPIYFLSIGHQTKMEMWEPTSRERVWTETYFLALGYLLYFLPRSGRSDQPIDFCKRHAFVSRSLEFPSRSRRARRAIDEYLIRMESI